MRYEEEKLNKRESIEEGEREDKKESYGERMGVVCFHFVYGALHAECIPIFCSIICKW